MTLDDESTSVTAHNDMDPSSSRTLASLIEKIKNQEDNEVWTRFYKRYNSHIRRIAISCRRTRCPLLTDADIEDIVMKVFNNVASKLKEFEYDPSKGNYRGYLAWITCCRCIDLQRLKNCRPGFNPPRDDLPEYKLEPNKRGIKHNKQPSAIYQDFCPGDIQTPKELEEAEQKKKKAKQQEIIFGEVFAELTGEMTKMIEAHDLEVGRKLALEKLRANNQKMTKRTFQIFEILTLGTPIADVCAKLGVTPNQVSSTRHKLLPLYEEALREAKAELDSPGEFPPSLNA